MAITLVVLLLAPFTVIAVETSRPERAALTNPVSLEGAFGRAEFDVQAPGISRLHLREADGSLSVKNLAYHNVFYYAALRAMARMSAAVGKSEQETRYAKLADAVKVEFNRRFWNEAACGEGNPAYYDWVDPQGIGHGHNP
jgi:hypothetical protein